MFFFRKSGLAALLTLVCCECFAQIFGGNPPSLHWKQINTPLARVIFPQPLDSIGQRVINIVTFINGPMQNTIGKKSKKINLVIQDQTTISNGYVGLGPFRSEFLLTPLQNSFELGSLPWPDQLTIHEFRHVQQYNNFDVGLSKVMHTVFGQEGQALANNATIPNWFYEGDAVYNETNVSKQGRGSLPFFYNGYRSVWQEGKHYSWMKLRNGSLKDFIPNWYPMGFLLVAYGREKYGDKFWENVTHDAAAFKGFFYPFQKAAKRYAGVDYVEFRDQAFDFFKQQFGLETIVPKKTRQRPGPYFDEEYPASIALDSFLEVKSGYNLVPEFVVRSGQSEKKIKTRDYSIDNQFSYRNGKIVFAVFRPDLRWGYRDYSDLRIINIRNGREHTLTNRTRYFSPDISDDGKRVLAVEEASSTACRLLILDAGTGKILHAVPNPDKLLYTYPKFYRQDSAIAAVRNTEGKMSMAIIDLPSGAAKYLLPFSYNVIGFPCLVHDSLFYSYSYHYDDELFCYTFSDKKVWKINYAQPLGFGKYEPAVNNAGLLWISFTAEGYRISQVARKRLTWEPTDTDLMDKNTSDFGITALQKTNANLLYKVPNDTFMIKKYPKGFQLFNFHSIQPSATDPDYSLNLISENILNSLQSQLTFTYDRAEKFKEVSFSGVFGGFFPFISAGINYLFDRRELYRGNPVNFNELQPYAGFNIPLNFSKNRSFTFLNVGSQFVYDQSNFSGLYKDTIGPISYSYTSSLLTFTHQVQQTIQEIFPPFAQSLNLTYKTPVAHYKGFQLVANGNVYLPGFTGNHSLVLHGAYLRKDSLNQINFSSGFPFSRGYSAINLYRTYKWGIDYAFPLLYPDAGFGNIAYLLRVRADLFYDNTHGQDFYRNGQKFTDAFRSTGAEIYFDSKWWNEASVTLGLRYSRLLDADLFGGTGRNRFEIILPVNILNQ